MRFLHCVAFYMYLCWFIYVYGNKHNCFENAMQCQKGMCKRDVAIWLKARLHIRFPHGFTALRCVFKVITFFHRHQQTKVSNKKTQSNAENACGNRMWQLGFNGTLLCFLISVLWNTLCCKRDRFLSS